MDADAATLKRPATPEEIEEMLGRVERAGKTDVRTEHQACLAGGLKDEFCLHCDQILLSCQHFCPCLGKPGCPFSNGKTLLDYFYGAETTGGKEGK